MKKRISNITYRVELVESRGAELRGINVGLISLALAPTSPQMLMAEMFKRTSGVQLDTVTIPTALLRV